MPRARGALKVRPQTEALEGRVVLTVTTLTVSASPIELRPINPQNQPHPVTLQHVIPVTISGLGTFTQGPVTVTYQVVDQFGRFMPSGTFAAPFQLQAGGPLAPGTLSFAYFKRIGLSILRQPFGRQYTITVTAQDATGARSASTTVVVPPTGFFHQNPSARHRP
jgi:hypothetical protein